MFLMLGMLWGGLLAGIPIVVHLLHRQKTTPIEWGAMQFLLESPVKMRRRKWIDNWLLLLVRMALLLLIVLALARPLLKTGEVKAKAPVDVAVVLDHSLSTGRRVAAAGAPAGQTLFDTGIPVIDKLRKVLPSGSTISVILAEHQPRIITPLPLSSNSDIDDMLSQLRQQKPGLTDGSLPLAVQEARRLVVSAGRNAKKMIVIVSDDQRSGWSIDNPVPWLAALGNRAPGGSGQDKDLSVYAISMSGAAATPNVSVGGLAIQPGMLATKRPCQIAFTVANHGPGNIASFPVQVTVDAHPLLTQVVPPLKPGDSQDFSIPYIFDTPGSHFVSASAQTADALEADNTAYSAARVVEQVNVLIIDGQLTDPEGKGYPAAEYLNSALQAANTARPKVIGLADAATENLDPYDVVILNDVPQLTDDFLGKLSDHVQRGHGAWIILGPRTRPEWVNTSLAKTPLFPNHLGTRATPAAAGVIDIKNPDNASLAMLTQAERSVFAGIAVKSWWRLTSSAAEQSTILEVNAEGTSNPLVLEHSVGGVGGRVILWTTAANRTWSNLPLATNFLPLVNETAFHLASGLTRAADYQLSQGQEIIWNGAPGGKIPAATVTRPDGAQHPATVRLAMDRPQVTYADTNLPGLYELKLDSPSFPRPIYYAVAIDPGELEARALSPAEFDSLKEQNILNDHITADDFATGHVFEIEVPGTDVAPWFILLAVLFLVFETFMTWRAAALQSGSDAHELLNQTA